MQRANIVYWEEEGSWLGYLQEYPDYWTQGDTLEDLQEHLRDLYRDVTRTGLGLGIFQICVGGGEGGVGQSGPS